MKRSQFLRLSLLGGLGSLGTLAGHGLWPASAQAATVQVQRRTVGPYSFYLTTFDLRDPNNFITISLANNAPQANTQQRGYGDEAFGPWVQRLHAAAVLNGTFFAKSPQQAVMGNMVAGGRFLKYSQWENFGTTLGLRVGNRPEMITARAEGKPQWQSHWFSITCGPRLLRQGQVWINPALEGFSDPNVLNGAADRTAVGFPADGSKLYFVNFDSSLTLQQEANVMRSIGCAEAMNLDGGASRALASGYRVLVPAGRELTNVIALYDQSHPATTALRQSWEQFQREGQVRTS
ncbi:MAG: phosphodiester glycosidase family protein [Prochlorothrix sp.]